MYDYLWAPAVRVQPAADQCAPPPEGNYRALSANLRAYSPTGDIHTSPTKGRLIARYEVNSSVAPRHRILALLRPDDPGRDALEEIVRPASRRGLQRPLDEDARRFLQRALHSPGPGSGPALPDPPPREPSPAGAQLHRQRSLAEELREAEKRVGQAPAARTEGSRAAGGGAVERERLGRLALAVEADEAEALGAAAARLDALLAESRALHRELAAIHRDLQTEWWRAGRCSGAARVLLAETRALHFLDDVVALLRGDVDASARTRAWPFALGGRQKGRSYVV